MRSSRGIIRILMISCSDMDEGSDDKKTPNKGGPVAGSESQVTRQWHFGVIESGWQAFSIQRCLVSRVGTWRL